jgi:DinB superfamily
VRPWFERRFSFEHLGEQDFPFLLERLRGAPARVEDKTRPLARELLTRRNGESWSIQEQVGHLIDLDGLHDARLEDYRAGAKELRPADLQNRKTHEAGYNERPLAELLEGFRGGRGRFVARLEAWEPQRLLVSAIHPRLQQPMRLVDMLYFVAEHDDHHLAWMTELACPQGVRSAW